MTDTTKSIYVFENWSAGPPRRIGILYVDHIKGGEHLSFEYDPDYLRNGDSRVVLDPDLSFYPGRQYAGNKPYFGFFSDSAPDRWGRMLIKRREAIIARNEGRKPRTLTETDYLLGVYDETRMGALRFSLDDGATFLSDDRSDAAPPFTTLRQLEEAARNFEKNEDPFNDKWLKQLLVPGSSLGGARPKATVRDTDGSFWIAKFPSKHDENDSGAWEKVTHDLAVLAGLNVPPAKLQKYSSSGSTFLVKRFDRCGSQRIHFMSAMTALGESDGASSADGVSYLQIADFIRSNGCCPADDLIELWKRVVFNMAVSNTDDHLRNHGFLLTKNGWRLSPAYDVNPNPGGEMLALNVNEESNLIDFEIALDAARYFGIPSDAGRKLAEEICDAVSLNWEGFAKRCGISRDNIELMRPAFPEKGKQIK
ncbi:MAG: type II toxin-antitoxin system HipA family toxin [Clostridia bacterium]|nr:type II toxin-antitoxin system HipA family toxin [Clostridia bacterium]